MIRSIASLASLASLASPEPCQIPPGSPSGCRARGRGEQSASQSLHVPLVMPVIAHYQRFWQFQWFQPQIRSFAEGDTAISHRTIITNHTGVNGETVEKTMTVMFTEVHTLPCLATFDHSLCWTSWMYIENPLDSIPHGWWSRLFRWLEMSLGQMTVCQIGMTEIDDCLLLGQAPSTVLFGCWQES